MKSKKKTRSLARINTVFNNVSTGSLWERQCKTIDNCQRHILVVSKISVSFLTLIFRRSRRRCSLKKVVLKNFAKFTGKHLCRSLFLNKAAGPRPVTLLKKRLQHRCILVKFPNLKNNSWQLPLHFDVRKTALGDISYFRSLDLAFQEFFS